MPKAHRHALGAEVRDRLPHVVFVDDEVVLAEAGDERPVESDTVAVTLISSTPLLKRNESWFGADPCWPSTAATARSAATAIDRARNLFIIFDPHEEQQRSSVRKLTGIFPRRRPLAS